MKKAALLLTLIFVGPALLHFLIILPDLARVAETGMCPPAPPDIPAYKCTVSQFYQRMLFGWSILANLGIFLLWNLFLGFCIAMYMVFYHKPKENKKATR